MKLTAKQKSTVKCPYCDSVNLDHGECDDGTDEGIIYKSMSCNDCQKEWTVKFIIWKVIDSY